MDYRVLGSAGLKVSSLCFGAATFGGGNDFFKAWGSTGVKKRNAWSACASIPALMSSTLRMFTQTACRRRSSGTPFREKRNELLISTKATFRFGEGPNNGSSRYHLFRPAREASSELVRITRRLSHARLRCVRRHR